MDVHRKVRRSIRVSILPSSAGLAEPAGTAPPLAGVPVPDAVAGSAQTATKNLLLVSSRQHSCPSRTSGT